MTDRVMLGLGSNLGNRHQLILQAYDETERLIGPIVGRSAFYETAPWGFQTEHHFLNTVACVETSLSPREILRATQEIEHLLGRRQKSVGGVYHDRPIDIDILCMTSGMVHDADLQIPHPLALQRDFVLRPLIEVFLQQ
jgi:2-amino-4-hydroxy-6-hydroxymethyldihydropteridine diphosphokinase